MIMLLLLALATICFFGHGFCALPESTPNVPGTACNLSIPVSVYFGSAFVSTQDAIQKMSCVLQIWVENEDDRAQFLVIYLQVTRSVAAELATPGFFIDTEWMANYCVGFVNYYRVAVYNWEVGNMDAVPVAWAIAFQHQQKRDLLLVQNALLGINAHILRDLPHIIADEKVYPDTSNKHEDSTKINDILIPIYQIVETSLIQFYAPVLNLTSFDLIIDWASVTGIELERQKAFWLAVVLDEADSVTNYVVSGYLETSSTAAATIIADLPKIPGNLFQRLKGLEGINSVQTMCNVVPIPCQ